MFLPQEIIRRKRDGVELDAAEITAFLRGFRDGSIAEGQIAAFAMAGFFRGMTRAETTALTPASILAKTEAAGLDGLVMDVKTGSGAFLPNEADALDLARSIVEVASRGGLKAVARLSDMSEVLGDAAGNALEIAEAIDCLTGAR